MTLHTCIKMISESLMRVWYSQKPMQCPVYIEDSDIYLMNELMALIFCILCLSTPTLIFFYPYVNPQQIVLLFIFIFEEAGLVYGGSFH